MKNSKLITRLFFLGLSVFACTPKSEKAAEAPVTIRFWHSMSGSLEVKLNKIIKAFNASQKKVIVEGTYKGNYTDALNGVVAAYRGGKQPHLTQVFEVGTQSMMRSGAIIPVEDLFLKFGQKMPKEDLLAPVSGYYSDLEDKMISMPFNSSTPIIYYNQDLMDQYGILKAPETWEEMFQVSHEIHEKSLVKAAQAKDKSLEVCGLDVGWQCWTMVENFLAINDIPIAIPENGFRGTEVKMNLKTPELLAHVAKVADAMAKKEFLFDGRRSEAPRRAFLARKCVFFIDSSSSIGTVKKEARFKWGTAFQPYLSGRSPQNSLIGGASLWVLKGHSDAEYKGIVDFFTFLAQANIQAEWHQGTGYIPITQSAYNLSKSQGFYTKAPNQETAVKQLLRGKITTNSRGIRLGNFSQVREVIEENLEKIWAGSMSAEQGLSEAEEGANLVLHRFHQLRKDSANTSVNSKEGAAP